MFVLRPLVLCCSLAAAPAQVSITASVAVPAVLVVAGTGPVAFDTVPAGPLPASGGRSVVQPGQGSVNLGWHTFEHSTRASFEIQHSLDVTASGASAGLSTLDVVLQVQASGPLPVIVHLEHSIQLGAGVPSPTARVDVGNDGTFELVESSPGPQSVWPLVLGPAPLQVLVRTDAVLGAPGLVVTGLVVRVEPANGVLVQPLLVGCASTYLHVLPSFVGDGIDLVAQPSSLPPDPAVAVLGLGVQPVALPWTTQLPCLLLPSPDLLLWLPPLQAVNLPLPATLRPIVFFAQGVVLVPGGLHTTGASSVQAH